MKQIFYNYNRDLMLRLIPNKSLPIQGMVTDPKDLAFDRTLKENGL
jgi:hypothetical protein